MTGLQNFSFLEDFTRLAGAGITRATCKNENYGPLECRV